MTWGKLAIQFPAAVGRFCRLQIFPRKRENLIANFPKGRGITTVSSLRKMLSTLLKRNWAAWFILDECTALLFWIKNETAGNPWDMLCLLLKISRGNFPFAWAIRESCGLHPLGKQRNSGQSWYYDIYTCT